jgi:hypothetical protein
MAVTTRQSNLFAAEDWKRLYTTFRTADFQSYDYETLRKSMVDYLRMYYPEDFNDYIESSEFIAMLDLIAFMGQSLAFRGDLNARENFLSTAERRDSVYRLASMLGYSPKRHINASGLLKIVSVNTTELLRDSSGRSLSNQTIFWDDPTNLDWQEQFTAVLNAALQPSQRIGRPSGSLVIGDVLNESYQLRLRSNLVPVFPFNATINGSSYPFESYSIGLDTTKGMYELSPQATDNFGFLFRNDGRGNSSGNTGYFIGFKQGQLNNLDFTISESLPNRLVGLNLENINNNDVWLYELSDAGGILNEWTKIENLRDSNIIYNSVADETRSLYSITSRLNDQIDLTFGDGIFSNIPTGRFRATVRVSNGLSYNIPPNAMQGVNLSIAYISKQNRLEGLTIKAALQYTVNNAEEREEISEIKANAPQYYYTQNRMINGQDYNVFPYTKFNEISKVKSVNRTASGISRFLDVKDATGKYSSTNVFCEDGYIYRTSVNQDTQFTWVNLNDIRKFVRNYIRSVINRKSTLHLFYDSFPNNLLTETLWVRGTTESNVSTGYFGTLNYEPWQIGDTVTTNRKFLKPGALVKFVAPIGSYFDLEGQLQVGTPSLPGETTNLWAAILSVLEDGTNNGAGFNDAGVGPVVINKNIPTNAIAESVYATYSTDITNKFEQDIVTYITNNQDFGIKYNSVEQEWQIINAADLDIDSNFNYAVEGQNWIIALINNGNTYSVYSRGLDYIFGSVIDTRFYFDSATRIYDPRSGTVIKDAIKFLKFNDNPEGTGNLGVDLVMEVTDSVLYPDGFKDDSVVKLTFADSDNDSIPDDPTVFELLVGDITVTSVLPNPEDVDKLVFLEKYLDFDNIERYRWKDPSTVSIAYVSLSEIELYGKFTNPVGTVFYAFGEQKFYVLVLEEEVRKIQESQDYIVRIGRSDLRFQYKHNSPNDRRIDPSPTNLIDMYVLTSSYDAEYRRYLKDVTGSLQEPKPMTTVDMALLFRDLENFKATSDAIIYNPVKYKPLFGTKAEANLQATFKVIRSDSTRLTNTQIRNNVVNAIDKYFAIQNWDFGDTFYFSELAGYLHKELSTDIAAIVIVPKYDNILFSDFMQIKAQPNELLISAATVDDVELIDAITASKLKATPGSNVSSGSTLQNRTATGGF